MRYLLRVFLVLSLWGMGFAQAVQPAIMFAAPPLLIAQMPARQTASPLLSPELQQALGTAKTTDRLRIIVRLKSAIRKTEKSSEVQASLLQPYLELDRASAASQRPSLIASLQAEASSSQASLNQFLQSPTIQTQTDAIRPFWIVNAIALRTTSEVINMLAQRDDVEAIEIDAWKKRIEAERLETRDWRLGAPALIAQSQLTESQRAEPQYVEPSISNPIIFDTDSEPLISESPISPSLHLQSLISQSPKSPGSLNLQSPLSPNTNPVLPPLAGTVAWGISKIRADLVQNNLGISGQGVVVANIDTGVDWQHSALHTQYRGYGNGVAPDHLHNWADMTDEGAAYPTDQNSHGTHTMGSIVGLNGIGVAPGAKWMACKGLIRDGYGLDSWLLACFQWLLAPNGEPGFAPDIINNSWGDESMTSELISIYKVVLQTVRAAGIFVVFSAGNSGPKPGTVGFPAAFPESIAIGATDSDDELASFSSRGPSPIGGAFKPILSAPGVRVISSVPGGAYKQFGGTSMAAPHVAGTAALLLSANPTLSIDSILNVLTRTAVPLSTTVPNNESGFGRIDAYAALLSVMDTGVLTGTVLEKVGGAPIRNARVIAFNNTNPAVRATGFTNADGSYSIPVPFGIYTASASAFGFGVVTLGPRLIVSHTVMALSFGLIELPVGVVRGRVRDAISGNVVTATVTVLNTPKSSLSLNSCPPCRYSLDLPAGRYVLESRSLGYRVQTQTVSIVANTITDLDFEMQPTQRIALVDSGAWYYGSQASYYHEALDALLLAYDDYRVKDILRDTPNITQLLKYDTVIWSAPFDAPGIIGASDTLSRYLSAGRNLLLSGQDIAYYDGGGVTYADYFGKLNAVFRSDDVRSDHVYGIPSSLLAGKVITITGGDGPYLYSSSDVLAVANQDKGGLIGTYAPNLDKSNIEGAGVYASLCFKHKSAYYGFGLEGIDSFADRVNVISRTLKAFDAPRETVGTELVSKDSGYTNDNHSPATISIAGSVITHVLRLRNIGEAGTTDTFNLKLNGNVWPTKLAVTSVALKPCTSTNITITVTIPPGASPNSSDVVTITATSQRAPTATDTLAFTTKTPGGILLVDDERFYNNEQSYFDALAANGNSRVDRWDSSAGAASQGSPASKSPSLAFLRQYSMVVWFNGYDWFDPITPPEQATLQKYLASGGRLFFSSQAALQYTGGNGFDQSFLGVGSVDYGDTITTVVGEPGNALGDGLAVSSMVPFPYNWNLSTAVQPLPNTTVFLRGNSGQPAALARQGISFSGPKPAQWRTAFLPFAFEALTPTLRAEVLNHAVGWLSWLGDSTLVADRTRVAIGEHVMYTLTLRADQFISTAPSQTVMLSVPLMGGLSLVTSTLPNASAVNAGSWRGFVKPGDVFTWTFEAQVNGNLPDYTPLTATLRVNLSEAGINWSRDSVVRMAAPRLQASFSLPAKPKWQTNSMFAMRLRNVGSTSVPSFTLSIPVPTGLGLAEDAQINVANAQGEIEIAAQDTTQAAAVQRVGNLIVIQRSLAAGAEIVVTYPISIPHFGQVPPAFYCTARIETDTGLVMQAAQWLWPDTRQYLIPFMFKQ